MLNLLLLLLTLTPGTQSLLVPMPDAKDVTRTPPIELVSFQVPITCPDSGEVLRFYQPRLDAQGYRLCGSPEVEWKTEPTILGESRSYRAVFVNDATQKAILLSAGCSLTNGRTSVPQQSVSLTLMHDISKSEAESKLRVTCSDSGK